MDTTPPQTVQDTVQQVPIMPPSLQQKGSLRKVFNIGSWIFLFALLPVTVLIFLSQDSIPGDLFYPVKRGMENVILAAASVNPATKAAFRTDLTATRFKEAQSLVLSKSNASGLSTFVDEVRTAQIEVASLANNTERQKAEEKLLVKIDQYQNGLNTLEAKTEQNLIAYQLQETPTLTPIPITAASNQNQTSPSFPSPTPTLTPSPIPTLTLAPTVIQIAPTVPPQQENTQVAEQKKIAEALRETRTTLEEIKKDLKEKRKEDKDENKDKSNRKTEAPDRENNPEKIHIDNL